MTMREGYISLNISICCSLQEEGDDLIIAPGACIVERSLTNLEIGEEGRDEDG
jgi:hypothetical protein